MEHITKHSVALVVLTFLTTALSLTSAPALGSSGVDDSLRLQEPLPENGRCTDRYPFPQECGPRD